MNTISKEAKKNQIRLMVQILSLEGSLLKIEQKKKIIDITAQYGILQGYKELDYQKEKNKQEKSINIPRTAL